MRYILSDSEIFEKGQKSPRELMLQLWPACAMIAYSKL
jgi:hypothetical protein